MSETPTSPSTDGTPDGEPTEASAADTAASTPKKNRVLKATGWMSLGAGLAQVIRLGSSVILTRLLLPDVYGLMEIVYVFYTGLHMFSDIGLEQNIIASKRGDDPVFLNTAWTFQVVRGLVLFGASVLIAFPVASFYGQPELTLLIPGVGLTAVFDGLYSTSIRTQARHLNLKPVVLIELGMQLSVVMVQVVVALISPTAWSLVIGAWVGTLAKAWASHALLRTHPHRLTWEPAAARELFTFGSWIFGSTALTFIYGQGDRLILAALLSLSDLGVYAIATRLRTAVISVSTSLIRSIVMPLIAERNREAGGDEGERREEVVRLYYRARLRLDALFMTGAGGLMTFGDTLIAVLYREDYHGAGPILQVLAIHVAMMAALGPSEAILTGIGQTKHYFLWSLGRTAWMLIGVPLGWLVAGFWGVVWMVATLEVPTVFILHRQMRSQGLWRTEREVLSLVFLGLGLVLGAIASTFVRSLAGP